MHAEPALRFLVVAAQRGGGRGARDPHARQPAGRARDRREMPSRQQPCRAPRARTSAGSRTSVAFPSRRRSAISRRIRWWCSARYVTSRGTAVAGSHRPRASRRRRVVAVSAAARGAGRRGRADAAREAAPGSAPRSAWAQAARARPTAPARRRSSPPSPRPRRAARPANVPHGQPSAGSYGSPQLSTPTHPARCTITAAPEDLFERNGGRWFSPHDRYRSRRRSNRRSFTTAPASRMIASA